MIPQTHVLFTSIICEIIIDGLSCLEIIIEMWLCIITNDMIFVLLEKYHSWHFVDIEYG